MTDLNWIKKGIQYLADLDADGASKNNGVGFNKVDSAFGRSLALQSAWTAKQYYAAGKMLCRYKAQLAAIGIVPYIPNFNDCKTDSDFTSKKSESSSAASASTQQALVWDIKPANGGISVSWRGSSADWQTALRAIKTIPNARFLSEKKRWYLPDASLGDAVKILSNLGFALPKEQAESVARSSAANSENFRLSAAMELQPLEGEETLPYPLRPFQRVAVEYVRRNKNVLIADEMGLGKTIEAIASIHLLHLTPALVIVPANLRLNWARELQVWLNGYYKYIVITNKSQCTTNAVSNADIVVINYDIISKPEVYAVLSAVDWQVVVMDESHYIKNEKSQRSKAAIALSKKAAQSILMTGTPITNNIPELIPQLNALKVLKSFGGKSGIKTRYWDVWTKTPKNLPELHEKLRSTCMVRRLKKDVLSELPPKTRVIQTMELSNDAEYRRAEKDYVTWLVDFRRSYSTQAERSQEIRRALNAEHIVRFEALKQASIYAKQDAIIGWIENFLESGESLVVFGIHTDFLDTIAQRFNAPKIVGGMKPADIELGKTMFQNGETPLIVCNIKAGGVGHTLTRASNVLMCEIGWTAADMTQAEDRVHRISQDDAVTVWYALGDGTIDAELYQRVVVKGRMASQALDGVEDDGIEVREAVDSDLLRKYNL